eukprot:gnl/Dysnectes_brevis/3200_a4000_1470.p1 GENE.gnl/Dysnectes_brevis/3200_a4000_1470~~gnl/Dysnectes_brevis/3200_a4000_1470.p1  ORF type:complete len:289 (-),score=53.26 gnl/Dysnectes_brevis/3200_a4000_1470:154-954(-)
MDGQRPPVMLQQPQEVDQEDPRLRIAADDMPIPPAFFGSSFTQVFQTIEEQRPGRVMEVLRDGISQEVIGEELATAPAMSAHEIAGESRHGSVAPPTSLTDQLLVSDSTQAMFRNGAHPQTMEPAPAPAPVARPPSLPDRGQDEWEHQEQEEPASLSAGADVPSDDGMFHSTQECAPAPHVEYGGYPADNAYGKGDPNFKPAAVDPVPRPTGAVWTHFTQSDLKEAAHMEDRGPLISFAAVAPVEHIDSFVKSTLPEPPRSPDSNI